SIVRDPHGALAVVGDARRPPEEVVADHGAADALAQLDLRLVLLKLAPAHQDAAALHAQGRATLPLAVPLHERAIAEADRAATGDPRDLVARPPERAVDEPHRPSVRGRDDDHGRVRAAERDELAVGDQDADRRARVHRHGRVAVVGPNAQEVAVAQAFLGLEESVTDAIAVTERVEDILPIGPPEDERLAVLHLPLEQLGAHAPPGVEVDILDAADVVDAVDYDPAAQRLPGDV